MLYYRRPNEACSTFTTSHVFEPVPYRITTEIAWFDNTYHVRIVSTTTLVDEGIYQYFNRSGREGKKKRVPTSLWEYVVELATPKKRIPSPVHFIKHSSSHRRSFTATTALPAVATGSYDSFSTTDHCRHHLSFSNK